MDCGPGGVGRGVGEEEADANSQDADPDASDNDDDLEGGDNLVQGEDTEDNGSSSSSEDDGSDPNQCGRKTKNFKGAIVNGVAAEEKEIPWIVGITMKDYPYFVCGGSIIHPSWIMTGFYRYLRYFVNE